MTSRQEILLTKDLGMVRIGAAVPDLRVADIASNIEHITETIVKAGTSGVQVLVFPEMAVTGYTIGDLVQQNSLLSAAEAGLSKLLASSARISMLILVGMPLRFEQKLFNCAVALNSGKILGIIPKSYLPTNKEFYEKRWFSPAAEAISDQVQLLGQQVPFGTDILFSLARHRAAIIGVEVCEDLWVPLAPHEHQALAGATLLCNLSASNEIIGKADWRRTMIASESGRCLAAYCYASSGIGESTNDVTFGGHALIAENGIILQESKRSAKKPQLIIADIDLERLEHDRSVTTSFHDASAESNIFRIIETPVADPPPGTICRTIEAHPFVPGNSTARAARCSEIFAMQVAGLSKKITGAKKQKIVIGVSGGLDSTLALLAAAKTMDFLGQPRTNVLAFSLPGFGTTRRTKTNASKLCLALGVTFETVDITRTCRSHLKDLKHDGTEDIVYENVQARYRTGFLFNKANEHDALVLGTGDLTETALGWCTFAGDHISHYHVNTSVPKTLVQYLIRWVADEEMQDKAVQKVLRDVLDTPISPELRRPENGQITQKSEEIIGPVELADFFLYPFIRQGMRPGKILFLAHEASRQGLFNRKYSLDELHQWLQSFIRRFFASQFKRTCLPEGPKIGSVSLSPRGDWRMPSDAEAGLWLEDLDQMYTSLSGQPVR